MVRYTFKRSASSQHQWMYSTTRWILRSVGSTALIHSHRKQQPFEFSSRSLSHILHQDWKWRHAVEHIAASTVALYSKQQDVILTVASWNHLHVKQRFLIFVFSKNFCLQSMILYLQIWRSMCKQTSQPSIHFQGWFESILYEYHLVLTFDHCCLASSSHTPSLPSFYPSRTFWARRSALSGR